MTQIKDLFQSLTKRNPQRYLFRSIEDELKTRKRLVESGENSLNWLNSLDTELAKEAAFYIGQQLEYDRKLYSNALERYSKLVELHTSQTDQFETFKSKVNQKERKQKIK
jgi:recombinational DNA repair ATPase RecF